MRKAIQGAVVALIASGLMSGAAVNAAQSEVKEVPATQTTKKKSDAPPKVMVAPPPAVKTTPEMRPSRPVMITTSDNLRSRHREKSNMLVSDDGLSLHLVGTIRSGFARQFKEALEENPDVKTIILSSDGGLVIEGIAVSKLIEKNGFDTHIEVVCASACTLAFLAGNRKTISRSGRLGFHQSHKGFFGNPNGSAIRNPGSWAMANAYREAGLKNETIDKALKTGPADMWFPDMAALVKDLKKAKIVADGSVDFKSAPWKSPLMMRRLLNSDPVWQNMEKTKPAKYLQAISKIWVDAIIQGDEDKAVEAVQDGLVNTLLAELGEYPDDIVESALQLQNDIWQLKSDKRNRKCVSIGKKRVPQILPVTFAHKERRDMLLKQMTAHDVANEEVTKEMQNKSEALVLQFWGLMLSETSTTASSVQREFCSKPKAYFEQLTKLPADERVATYRALMSNELSTKTLINWP